MVSSAKATSRIIAVTLLLAICFVNGTYVIDDRNYIDADFVALDHMRSKRDAVEDATATKQAAVTSEAPPTNSTDESNKTNKATSDAAVNVPTSVTQTPLFGFNGTGIRNTNLTTATPDVRVSDPINPEENITAIFKETPEMIKAEQNLTNLTYDNHDFYNSTFIGNATYFDEYWTNITKHTANVHAVLSNSHRRATSIRLTFEFPFYGNSLRNISVATGGFIYTGEHVHNWLAATQYIAPLMANFDTTLTNESAIKMYDDGERFTTFWENVTLHEDPSKEFTFAVTLEKSGDITFAYKQIPVSVQNITDMEHPVKVGISDAYLTDRIMFLVRRKTIYEYHRVSFKNHEIANKTILKLTALPTCLQYETCESCVNHATGFDCMWCDALHKCSSGTDRNKQDWTLRNCDRVQISNASSCPKSAQPPAAPHENGNVAYVTDSQTPLPTEVRNISPPSPSPGYQGIVSDKKIETHSPIGGVVAAFLAITLVCSLVAWTLYAFKNPHTRSGQLLIKYRPSQWSWRRGEARYTAATIHM